MCQNILETYDLILFSTFFLHVKYIIKHHQYLEVDFNCHVQAFQARHVLVKDLAKAAQVPTHGTHGTHGGTGFNRRPCACLWSTWTGAAKHSEFLDT